MKKNITSLEELEKEQEKLAMLMELTQQEFARNLGSNRKQLKNFLFNKVALPVSAVGVGVSVMKNVFPDKNEHTNSSGKKNIWEQLLPIGLDLLQLYTQNQQKEK